MLSHYWLNTLHFAGMPRVKLFNESEALEKAMELFWKQGFHATSMQDLVDHLGINRASLYSTFGDKRSLFDQAFKLYQKNGAEGTRDFLSSQPTVRGGFRALFDRAITESVNDPENKGCFVVNTTTEFLPGDEEMKTLLQHNKDTFEQIFLEQLIKAESMGEIPEGKDLPSIAGLLFTLYNGMKVLAKVRPDKEAHLASVDAVLSLLD